MLNDHNIEWEEKQHTEAKILAADEIIKSPGIPKEAPMVKKPQTRAYISSARLSLQDDTLTRR